MRDQLELNVNKALHQYRESIHDDKAEWPPTCPIIIGKIEKRAVELSGKDASVKEIKSILKDKLDTANQIQTDEATPKHLSEIMSKEHFIICLTAQGKNVQLTEQHNVILVDNIRTDISSVITEEDYEDRETPPITHEEVKDIINWALNSGFINQHAIQLNIRGTEGTWQLVHAELGERDSLLLTIEQGIYTIDTASQSVIDIDDETKVAYGTKAEIQSQTTRKRHFTGSLKPSNLPLQ